MSHIFKRNQLFLLTFLNDNRYCKEKRHIPVKTSNDMNNECLAF